MRHLMIGGSRDGERLTVNHHANRIEFPVFNSFYQGIEISDEWYCKKECYRKEEFLCKEGSKYKSFIFFIESNLSTAAAMEKLIEGYGRAII